MYSNIDMFVKNVANRQIGLKHNLMKSLKAKAE